VVRVKGLKPTDTVLVDGHGNSPSTVHEGIFGTKLQGALRVHITQKLDFMCKKAIGFTSDFWRLIHGVTKVKRHITQ